MYHTVRLHPVLCTFSCDMAAVYKTPVPRRSRKLDAQVKTEQDAKEPDTIINSPQLSTLDGSVTQPDFPRLQATFEDEPQTTPAVEAQSSSAKRKASTTAPWYAHKKLIIMAHPDMSSVEQLILAKKTYEPLGRQRSAQSLHREAFLLRNPNHGLEWGDLQRAIRVDLLSRI